MRVGISVNSTYVVDDFGDAPRAVIERVAAASGAGLDYLTIGDHHATGGVSYVQNVPMLGRLLAEWDERPAGLLFLVPAWHPLLMAEQIGTLAAIAAGPFIVQTGLGGADQVAAMGVDRRERAARLEDGIVLTKRLLAGETVSDERWGIHDAAISPRPPRAVEWWIGAGAPVALDRAARLGDVWYGNADLTAESARAQRDEYWASCERHGRAPGPIAVRKDVLVADDGAAATQLGQQLIDRGYRGMPREAVAFGDVDAVAEQLAVYGDLGFRDVIVRTMAVEQSAAVRSIELMAEVRTLLAGDEAG